MTNIRGGMVTTSLVESVNGRLNPALPTTKHEGRASPVPAKPSPRSPPMPSQDLIPVEASRNKAPATLPFGLIKVTVRGQSIPEFGYKTVLLQCCQKASHLFMQIAAEIGGGFCNGSPHESEYRISVLLSEGSGSTSGSAERKQHIILDDGDLQSLLQPFAEAKEVSDVCNFPLILINFVHSDRLNPATARAKELATQRFYTMVDEVRTDSKSLYIDDDTTSILLNAVNDAEYGGDLARNDHTEKCLEDGKPESHTIDNQAERPRKRRRLSGSSLDNTQTQTTSYRATDQATQNEVINALLEDKAKLSLKVSKLAEELERTTLARDFLRSHLQSQKKVTAASERYLRYESRWYMKRFEEAKGLIDTIQKDKKLVETKSAYLVKKTRQQSKVLKQAKSFIEVLQEKMEDLEAKKNIRIGDLEGELRKALVYVDGLHNYYNISTTKSATLAQQFCDNLQEREQHEATQLVPAGEERRNLKRKRSESES